MSMAEINMEILVRRDMQTVWEMLQAVEGYPAWRRNVSRVEVINEKQFIEYTKDGYSTTFTVLTSEPSSRLELDVENSHIKGRWIGTFIPSGNETVMKVTASGTAKQLSSRPIGKGVFENVYLKKELEQFAEDLKKGAGGTGCSR